MSQSNTKKPLFVTMSEHNSMSLFLFFKSFEPNWLVSMKYVVALVYWLLGAWHQNILAEQ